MRTKPLAVEPPMEPGEFDAVCGIGNPGGFRATLREMGLKPRDFRVFPDHHVYIRADFAGRGRPLLTTGKDEAKLRGLTLDVPVHRVKTGAEIQPAGEFVDLVRTVII
jgi:tetraacyldisaccharide 4'-kinase